ncbi:DNA-directed DNA polymerase [Tanacetum coccineum]
MLSELKISVHELAKVISDVLVSRNEVKGITTRGGKITEVTYNKEINETNLKRNEPLKLQSNEQEKPEEAVVNKEPEIILEQNTKPPIKQQQPSVPFPNRLRKEKEEVQQQRFLENLKQLYINIPFIKALVQMPKYAKYLKGLLTNKSRLEEACTMMMNERCSALMLNKLPLKEKDPGSFTIPCQVSDLRIDNALANLGASISLMPYTMYERLGLGEPKPTRMSLELADRSIQYPKGIVDNVLIKVDKFVLPFDFVILDMPENSRIPIILGRPFLATARAMTDVFNKKITLRVGDDEVIFDMDQSMKNPSS